MPAPSADILSVPKHPQLYRHRKQHRIQTLKLFSRHQHLYKEHVQVLTHLKRNHLKMKLPQLQQLPPHSRSRGRGRVNLDMQVP